MTEKEVMHILRKKDYIIVPFAHNGGICGNIRNSLCPTLLSFVGITTDSIGNHFNRSTELSNKEIFKIF